MKLDNKKKSNNSTPPLVQICFVRHLSHEIEKDELILEKVENQIQNIINKIRRYISPAVLQYIYMCVCV